jgi:hypothetical protein
MPSLVDTYQDYLAAGTSFSRLAPAGTGRQTVYALFNQDRRDLLPFVDTGLIYPGEGEQIGDPSLARSFDSIHFSGGGTLFVNVWIDQTLLSRDVRVVLAEDAWQAALLKLPEGTAGFGIRLQMTGLAWIRLIKFDWDPLETQ